MTPLILTNIDRLWRHFERFKTNQIILFFNTAFHTGNKNENAFSIFLKLVFLPVWITKKNLSYHLDTLYLLNLFEIEVVVRTFVL